MSAAEQAQSGLPGGGESWELGLRLARTGPFEVRGIRTVDFAAELPLSLASVAEATTQRGTLTIRALGDSSLAIKNRRLVSVPAELLESDRYQSVRGTFHYQPGHEELGTETAISIAPTEPVQAESGAWVWRQRLESRFGLDGTTLHCATFYVQTAGRQRLRLSLPLGGRLHETWLESQRLTLAEATPDESSWPIDLPGGRSFATLTVYYSTPDELPGLSGSYLPRFAHLDIPTMQHQWCRWLPPGYAIFDAPPQPSGWTQEASWTERLFSALARGSGATIFNPLAGRDWRQLFNSGLAAPHARLAGEEFLRELSTAVEEQSGGEELTWGQLLATCAQRQTRRTIWVDADSLRSVGVTPQTRVVVSERASDRGTGVLKQANLVLVVLDDSVLLTSTLAAAALNAQLVPLDNHVLYTAGPGPLASELQGVNLAGRSVAFCHIRCLAKYDRAAGTSGSVERARAAACRRGTRLDQSLIRYLGRRSISPADRPRAHSAGDCLSHVSRPPWARDSLSPGASRRFWYCGLPSPPLGRWCCRPLTCRWPMRLALPHCSALSCALSGCQKRLWRRRVRPPRRSRPAAAWCGRARCCCSWH